VRLLLAEIQVDVAEKHPGLAGKMLEAQGKMYVRFEDDEALRASLRSLIGSFSTTREAIELLQQRPELK